MNKFILIGNLTRDPESGKTNSGNAFCKLSVAVNRTYSSNGEKQTDFFNITAWRALADNCAKYLKKGSKVCVTATLQNHSYEDKDGVKRSTNEIIAESVEFLTAVKNDAQGEPDAVEEDSDFPF